MPDVIEKDFAANRQLAINFCARCAIGGQSLLRLVAVVFQAALLAYGKRHPRSPTAKEAHESTRFSQIRNRPRSRLALPRPRIRRLSRPADQADRAVLARRRDRRGRPAVGGADEGRCSAPSSSRTRRRRRRDRRDRGGARAAGRPHLPVRQYQHAGAHSGDHDESALRSGQGFRRRSTSWRLADLDRGARVGAGKQRSRSSSPTPRPIRASCPTARPAPAP